MYDMQQTASNNQQSAISNQQSRKMVEIDRVFLTLLAVIMYAHGVSKLVIGTIIVSTLILEYMFYQEQCRVNAYYAYPVRKALTVQEL